MKKILQIFAAIVLITTFVSVYSNQAVFAAECAVAQHTGLDTCKLPNAPSNIIANALQLFFGIIGLVSVFMVTLGGFRYVISRGEPQNMAKAKNTILWAIIGLVIAIFAQVIISFVIKRVSPS